MVSQETHTSSDQPAATLLIAFKFHGEMSATTDTLVKVFDALVEHIPFCFIWQDFHGQFVGSILSKKRAVTPLGVNC